jgi:hypothetical protein
LPPEIAATDSLPGPRAMLVAFSRFAGLLFRRPRRDRLRLPAIAKRAPRS